MRKYQRKILEFKKMLRRLLYFYVFKDWLKKRLTIVTALLWPFSFLYYVKTHRYGAGLFQRTPKKLNIPVVGVGAVTFGDHGQVQVMLRIVQFFQEQGLRPGVVVHSPEAGEGRMNAQVSVGGVALIQQQTKVPVCVLEQSTKMLDTFMAENRIDIVVSDGVFQPALIHNDVKIILMDADTWLGNKHVFPAGPLRAALHRLDETHCVLLHIPYSAYAAKLQPESDPCAMYRDKISYLQRFAPQCPIAFCQEVPLRFRNLENHANVPIDGFANANVHAGAGFASASNFFRTLKTLGLHCKKIILQEGYNQPVLGKLRFEPIYFFISACAKPYFEDSEGWQKLWVLESTLCIARENTFLQQIMEKIQQPHD